MRKQTILLLLVACGGRLETGKATQSTIVDAAASDAEPADAGSCAPEKPDAAPPFDCWCDPAAVGDWAERMCTSAGQLPGRRFVLYRERGVDDAGTRCSIGCVDPGGLPDEADMCNASIVTPYAKSRCKGAFSLLPWRDTCVLRCETY